jgi:hypothetical protein
VIKRIVCFSGGHASAIAAEETVRKHGKEGVILLNHDISSEVEHEDIKRFKKQYAEYRGLPITYANMDGYQDLTPLRVCRKVGAFQPAAGQALCTYNLKTKPFYEWLEKNYPVSPGQIRDDVRIIYGFDGSELHRVQRRIGIMATKGYQCEFPLLEKRTIENIEEVGIERPRTYKIFKHANCIGCLKAGKQHWYVVYCLRPDIFEEAVAAEKELGHSIIKDAFLEDMIPKFEEMKKKHICPSDKGQSATFWSAVDAILPEQTSFLPCDCAIL